MLDNFQPVSPEEISEERKTEIIEKLAKGIVKRRLTAPAIMFLESIKPINYIGSQLLIFLEPVVLAIFPISQYREVAIILEERDSIEHIIKAIEKFDDESIAAQKAEKQAAKEKKAINSKKADNK